MNPGDNVTIFTDPVKETKQEGQAKLIKLVQTCPGTPALQSWRVQFDADEPGDTYHRLILRDGVNSQ